MIVNCGVLVCLSICAKTAGWIEVLFRVEAMGGGEGVGEDGKSLTSDAAFASRLLWPLVEFHAFQYSDVSNM